MPTASDTILEQLQAAFPTEPIDPTGAFADWGTTYSDVDEYTRHLEGKSWEQLEASYFVKRSDALGFLGTKHLVAVLPVYLRAMVKDGVWSEASGMLTVILAKPAPGKDTGLGASRFDALVTALSDAQRVAVAASLSALFEQDPDGSLGHAARSALDGYWSRFLPAVA
jgi:hypothetical protein